MVLFTTSGEQGRNVVTCNSMSEGSLKTAAASPSCSYECIMWLLEWGERDRTHDCRLDDGERHTAGGRRSCELQDMHMLLHSVQCNVHLARLVQDVGHSIRSHTSSFAEVPLPIALHCRRRSCSWPGCLKPELLMPLLHMQLSATASAATATIHSVVHQAWMHHPPPPPPPGAGGRAGIAQSPHHQYSKSKFLLLLS